MASRFKRRNTWPETPKEETPSKAWSRNHSVFQEAGKVGKRGSKSLPRKVRQFPAQPGKTSPQ